jgi:hypothetical protein
MSNLRNSGSGSSENLTQLPLKGFHIEVKSGKPEWRKLIEGMGDGRFRVHMTKIKK